MPSPQVNLLFYRQPATSEVFAQANTSQLSKSKCCIVSMTLFKKT